jgi:hypothetical protein
MSDQATSLPIRTEANSDAIVALSDATIISQTMEIDSDNDAHVKAKLRDDSGNAFGTPLNPIVVEQVNGVSGDPVADYDTVVAVIKDAVDNHDYPTTAAKTLLLSGFCGSASGKAKFEFQIEDGPAAGTYTTKAVLFNSTATPNVEFKLDNPLELAATVNVRVIRTNLENQAQDLYSTIKGIEI